MIKRLKLTNFGGHEALDIDLNGRCVGILGANFTGKSTVLKALEFAWTGGLDEKAESFVRSAADGSVSNAEVEMDFEKNGITGKIYRRVGKSPKRWLELSTMLNADGKPERIAKAAEIDRQLAAIFCADKQAIANAIFLPQGYLDKLLFGDQPEREKLFMRLLLIGHFGTVENAVDTQITNVSAMLQDCGTVMDEVRTQLRDSQEKQQTLTANLAGLLDPSETITRYRTYLNAVKAQEAAMNGVSLAEVANEASRAKVSTAVAPLTKSMAGITADSFKEVLESANTELTTADIRAAALLTECGELSAFITRAETLSAAWADHERLKAAGLVFATERATLQTALDALPKDIAAQMKQLQDIATHGQLVVSARKTQDEALAKHAEASEAEALNPKTQDMVDALTADLAAPEKEIGVLEMRVALCKQLRDHQEKAHADADHCPVCKQTIPAEVLVSEFDTARLVALQETATRWRNDRSALVRQMTLRTEAVRTTQAAYLNAEAELKTVVEATPWPYTGTYSFEELNAMLIQQQELTAKLGTVNVQDTHNETEIGRITAKWPATSFAWLAIEAKPEIVTQKKARLAEATKLRDDWVTYVNYWRPEVAKLQTALREAGESSGRYEAAVEANRNAKAVLLDAMKAITATQGDSKDADPTRIAMELPILEGTQTQRQQLQGELRQLDSAIATLHKRLKELKDLQDKQADVRALVEDLRRLKGTFTRQGLPRMYLSERFNQLTGLTQRNLGMLNANFVVTPSVDEVLSFDFTDQERPWIGKLPQSKLSGAQRVLLTISFLLAVQQLILPQVGLLVIDEPSNHLGVPQKEDLRDLFASLNQTLANTDAQIIVVDHDPIVMQALTKVVRLTRQLSKPEEQPK